MIPMRLERRPPAAVRELPSPGAMFRLTVADTPPPRLARLSDFERKKLTTNEPPTKLVNCGNYSKKPENANAVCCLS